MIVEEEILEFSKTTAVVSLSPGDDRPSYSVASYLQQQGYQ